MTMTKTFRDPDAHRFDRLLFINFLFLCYCYCNIIVRIIVIVFLSAALTTSTKRNRVAVRSEKLLVRANTYNNIIMYTHSAFIMKLLGRVRHRDGSFKPETNGTLLSK